MTVFKAVQWMGYLEKRLLQLQESLEATIMKIALIMT